MERQEALDAFRGIAIAAMILVNNPGSWDAVYRPLQHAVWSGWTPADLIFPTFLFIVGVAIAFSLGTTAPGLPARRLLVGKVARRAATIFALGILLNGFPRFDWSVLRIPGVLQRIALCYAGAALLVLTSGVRAQTVAAVLLVIGYWVAMAWLPFADAAPDRFAQQANLASFIDRALLPDHLLHPEWDPEGLLSTLPALATTLAGVLTGHWLRSQRNRWERLTGLFVAGDVALGLGLLLNHWCPINKNLWTSSYVVFTAGMALQGLGLCYWLIDILGYRGWAKPFTMYGTNPIVAYVLSSLLAKTLLLWQVVQPDGSKISLQQYLFAAVFLPFGDQKTASLLYAISYVLVWLGITAFLYRQRVTIKV